MNISDRENIFHKLMRTSKMVSHKTFDSLSEIGLFRGQPPLLMALWNKDCQSRKELCDLMDRKPATITKMVKRLESNDFVTSRIDIVDSRVSRVCLTDKGKAIEEPVKMLHQELQSAVFEGFTDEELNTFGELLDKIRGNMMMVKEYEHE